MSNSTNLGIIFPNCQASGPRPSKKKNNGGEVETVSLEMSYPFMVNLRISKEINETCSMIDLLNTQLTKTRLKQSERIEQTLLCQCLDVCKRYETKDSNKHTLKTQTFSLALFTNEFVNKNVDPNEPLSYFDWDKVASLEIVRCQPDVSIPKKQENYDDLNKRQQHRRRTLIKQQSKKSLSFLTQYQLVPKAIISTSSCGQEVQISFESKGDKSPGSTCDSLRSLVGVMDRFCVSEAAYHEITQLYPNLPRTHSVINTRREMTASLAISRVPGEVNGAMVSFRQELDKSLKEKILENPNLKEVMVQLSSDGTHVSRISNYVIFAFRLVDATYTDNHSADNVITLAILNCREDYFKLKTSLQPLCEEINSVIEAGRVHIDDKEIAVNIVFCADMKMILTVMGLGGVSCNHSCPWCLVHRDDRHNMTHPLDYFNSDNMMRNWQRVTEHAAKREYGVHHTPLLKIEMEDFILDELHLLLRITDVLEKNLINDAMTRDKERAAVKENPKHMGELVKAIKSCGVPFSYWEEKETKKLKWTSLNGLEKRKLLSKLPQALKGKLQSNTEEKVLSLWKLLDDIYSTITASEPMRAEEVFKLSQTWVETFLSLGPHLSGYTEKNVTPYVHCMVYHVPFMLRKFGTLRKFSCQAFEKHNDVVKKIHQRKSNKWDPTVEALQICKRMEESSKSKRDKRQYTKRRPKYWNEEIREVRSAKRAKLDEINSQAVQPADP
ncbi:uncharacterized protein [Haliotis cracherodii]|uniref:uncharacterized protein n=1 Tax=Haliotis cracherodii TaxID=6455 RepID=UPI0039ECF309